MGIGDPVEIIDVELAPEEVPEPLTEDVPLEAPGERSQRRTGWSAVLYLEDSDHVAAYAEKLASRLDAATRSNPEMLQAPRRDSYKVREIKDGERGITYQELFGRDLPDAEQIHIVDPDVRKAFQVRNVEDVTDAVDLQRGAQASLTTMYRCATGTTCL